MRWWKISRVISTITEWNVSELYKNILPALLHQLSPCLIPLVIFHAALGVPIATNWSLHDGLSLLCSVNPLLFHRVAKRLLSAFAIASGVLIHLAIYERTFVSFYSVPPCCLISVYLSIVNFGCGIRTHQRLLLVIRPFQSKSCRRYMIITLFLHRAIGAKNYRAIFIHSIINYPTIS